MEEQETSKESITLTKNAKGDYQWIVKVKSDLLSDEALKRLETMNTELEKQYGKKY